MLGEQRLPLSAAALGRCPGLAAREGAELGVGLRRAEADGDDSLPALGTGRRGAAAAPARFDAIASHPDRRPGPALTIS